MNEILKLITGDIHPEESKKLVSDINHDPETRELFNKIKVTSALYSSTKKMKDYQIEESYNNLKKKLPGKNRSVLFRLNPVLRYAAVVVLLLCFSGLTFYLGRKNALTPSETERFSTLVTAYGQTSKVILPDSSIVWLNSGTTLTYNNSFSETNRLINLHGEAYFDVKRNEKIPMTIKMKHLHLKVLGTKFNARAYSDDDKLSVVLDKGSVQISHPQKHFKEIILKPGQLAEFDIEHNKMSIKQANSKIYTSWKEGILHFENNPMAETIKKLKRKFNIDIEIVSPEVYDLVFTGTIKDENLEDVLEMMKYASGLEYKIQYSHEADILTRVIISK